MKILAFELSTGHGSIALLESERVSFARGFANNRKHSGLFFENLQNCSKEFGSPDAIVVGLGPGSYAGVRIAIATAVGLRVASEAKLCGIPSICAIETEARNYRVIGDARRDSFFFGRVSDGRLVEGPSLYSCVELEDKIRESTLPVYVSEPLSQFPMATLAYPSARRLAELIREQVSEMPDSESLEPIYLREPFITVPKTPAMTVTRR